MQNIKVLSLSLLLSLGIFSSSYSMDKIKSYLIQAASESFIVLSQEEQTQIAYAYQTQSLSRADALRKNLKQRAQEKFNKAIEEKDYATVISMLDLDKIVKEHLENSYVESIGTIVEFNTIVQAFNLHDKTLENPWQLIRALKLDAFLQNTAVNRDTILNYINVQQIRNAINFNTQTINKTQLINAFNLNEILETHITLKVIKKYINADILKQAFNFDNATQPALNFDRIQNAIKWQDILYLNQEQIKHAQENLIEVLKHIQEVLQKSMQNTINTSSTALVTLNQATNSLISQNPATSGTVLAAALLTGGTYLGYRYLHQEPTTTILPTANQPKTQSWLDYLRSLLEEPITTHNNNNSNNNNNN